MTVAVVKRLADIARFSHLTHRPDRPTRGGSHGQAPSPFLRVRLAYCISIACDSCSSFPVSLRPVVALRWFRMLFRGTTAACLGHGLSGRDDRAPSSLVGSRQIIWLCLVDDVDPHVPLDVPLRTTLAASLKSIRIAKRCLGGIQKRRGYREDVGEQGGRSGAPLGEQSCGRCAVVGQSDGLSQPHARGFPSILPSRPAAAQRRVRCESCQEAVPLHPGAEGRRKTLHPVPYPRSHSACDPRAIRRWL
jgi:hypothetical protein